MFVFRVYFVFIVFYIPLKLRMESTESRQSIGISNDSALDSDSLGSDEVFFE